MKKIILLINIIFIIFFLGKDLLPINDYFFTFHDETQLTRINQFTKEIKNFHIPPRIAPDMNYRLGFPIFNFYAPTAYWITSFINILGFNELNSLKISFLLALITGFSGAYLLNKLFFDFYSSLLGANIYVSSLYIALDIFVRGNLAEIWFLSLLPLTIFFILKNSQNKNTKIFFLSTFLQFLLFTTHNIYSSFIIIIIPIIIIINKNKKNNFLSFLIALFLSFYFWIPLILEMKYVWADYVAKLTNYKDHFLCIRQLWNSPWGFGLSIPGCEFDGMSFQIGKIQIILFLLGIITFLIIFLTNKKLIKKMDIFFLLFTLISIFLTHHFSKKIWNLFNFYLPLFQFPWRFLGLSLIGISYFSSYFFYNFNLLKK